MNNGSNVQNKDVRVEENRNMVTALPDTVIGKEV